MAFHGFPYAAVGFYRSLETYNNKEWWASHRDVYYEVVREPFDALLRDLAPDFGAPTVFQPHRDLRFSTNKSPYKTHQGAIAAPEAGGAFYLRIDSEGLLAGGGAYQLSDDQLTRYRAATLDPQAADQLDRIVASLKNAGLEVSHESTRPRPRGTVANAAPLELVRVTSLHARRKFGVPAWLSTPDAAAHVREVWEATRPLVQWFGAHVGRPERLPGSLR